MEELNELSPYVLVIAASVIIIVSYLFNVVSQKTNIPSVILLILTGIGISQGLKYIGLDLEDILFKVLEVLGILGLIMIVLEAALDLKLGRDKLKLIINSFVVAFLSLGLTCFAIAYILVYFLEMEMMNAILYSVPLSVMSSSIIIPSVANLIGSKKEFLIYEATFSDILGIMVFYFIIGNANASDAKEVFFDISSNITLTVLLSIILGYALVYLIQKLDSKVKLFLLISFLILLYSVGKYYKLSSLIIILLFGLLLNNHKLFFRGWFKQFTNEKKLNEALDDLHLVTLETAFVVRTFFFVIFGMTLQLKSLLSIQTAIVSLIIILATYIIRWPLLKIFSNRSLKPAFFVTPRGLITILLYFSIPDEFKFEEFRPGILLYVIMLTNIVMTYGLITDKSDKSEDIEKLEFDDWEELDEELKLLKEEDNNDDQSTENTQDKIEQQEEKK
ncbi:cation:proton antiporter domain-containing protein [Marinigracilibium pacificum]|uniref:Sodium:proton exchanger n=1 Tax=Marinigracilibium pacificum TaxID=2729599 RepID=A0A848J621_9BACT|nr:cation:proton antiporter [Marinigracilibium pacificum]NMM49819.1 sodium:proton exchanger [Marinigracilibium pacificum]